MPLIFNMNSWEVLVVLFLILLLFGGKKIPELAKGLGKGIREFNNARYSIENEIKEGMKEAERKPVEPEKISAEEKIEIDRKMLEARIEADKKALEELKAKNAN